MKPVARLHDVALAWARADRAADDRAAELRNLDSLIAQMSGAIPAGLAQARASAQQALTHACQFEACAEEALHEVARTTLDLHFPVPEAPQGAS